jgi:hypothetical protein
MQLLLFAALAFVFLFETGLYPAEIPSLNSDSDWLYRRLAHRQYGDVGHGPSGFFCDLLLSRIAMPFWGTSASRGGAAFASFQVRSRAGGESRTDPG